MDQLRQPKLAGQQQPQPLERGRPKPTPHPQPKTTLIKLATRWVYFEFSRLQTSLHPLGWFVLKFPRFKIEFTNLSSHPSDKLIKEFLK